jgi:deazaflavin-dependent oxidoreductase (nitroreductase family)
LRTVRVLVNGENARARKDGVKRVSQIPRSVRLGNAVSKSLLHTGLRPRGRGGHPLYLITVKGRRSGLPRTVVLSVIEADGKRYLAAPFGVVDWVRNLRASGEAVLTRGRRSETIHARELSPKDAGAFLRDAVRLDRLSARYFGVSSQSSLEDLESAAKRHPVFLLEGR